MITLTSKWKLRAGCPPELLGALEELAQHVGDTEAGTLTYLVNVLAAPPLDGEHRRLDPPPAPIPHSQQTEITFIEVYRDARAFADHVNGPVFTSFRRDYLHHFYEDPANPGWPNTDTVFFQRLATARADDPHAT